MGWFMQSTVCYAVESIKQNSLFPGTTCTAGLGLVCLNSCNLGVVGTLHG